MRRWAGGARGKARVRDGCRRDSTCRCAITSHPPNAGYVDTLVITGEDNKGTFDPSGSHGSEWDRRPIEPGGLAGYVPRPGAGGVSRAGWPKSFGAGRGVPRAGGGVGVGGEGGVGEFPGLAVGLGEGRGVAVGAEVGEREGEGVLEG